VLARLAESIELINDGVKAVRIICSGLRPGVLDDLGLAAAIEWQASEFATRNNIRCEVSVPPLIYTWMVTERRRLSEYSRSGLTNVIRHAQAKSVRVDLCQEDENILLVVKDDGKGFSEAGFRTPLGLWAPGNERTRAVLRRRRADLQFPWQWDHSYRARSRGYSRAERSEVCTS